MLRVIYGLTIPKEIIELHKKDLAEKENYFVDAKHQEMYFIPKDDIFICGMEVSEAKEWFMFDTEQMNEFTQKDNMYKFFNSYMPRILKLWVDYIGKETDRLKNEGLSEEEVGLQLAHVDMKDSVEFQFYVANT